MSEDISQNFISQILLKKKYTSLLYVYEVGIEILMADRAPDWLPDPQKEASVAGTEKWTMRSTVLGQRHEFKLNAGSRAVADYCRYQVFESSG